MTLILPQSSLTSLIHPGNTCTVLSVAKIKPKPLRIIYPCAALPVVEIKPKPLRIVYSCTARLVAEINIKPLRIFVLV